MKRLFLFASLSLLLVPAFAQPTIIHLENPSFEDEPGIAKTPRNWSDCTFMGETPPDVQPDLTFGVKTPALFGDSYLGMVTRDNSTWEGVGQRLSSPLDPGQCYQFSFYAATSPDYHSVSRLYPVAVNYNKPVKLLIWGGHTLCDKRQLLVETEAIHHGDWKRYEFFFKPDAPYSHLILEAFYTNPKDKPACGNLLLDNLSGISPVTCPETYSPKAYSATSAYEDFVNLDTISFVMPEGYDDLERYTAMYSKKIAFDDQNRLERHYYWVPYQDSGGLFYQNQYLHFLITVAEQMKNVKLTIAIPEVEKPALASKIKSVKELINFIGAYSTNIKVISFSKADPKKNWVGNLDGVLLLVERK